MMYEEGVIIFEFVFAGDGLALRWICPYIHARLVFLLKTVGRIDIQLCFLWRRIDIRKQRSVENRLTYIIVFAGHYT